MEKKDLSATMLLLKNAIPSLIIVPALAIQLGAANIRAADSGHNGSTADSLFASAKTLIDQGEIDSAIETLENYLKGDSSNAYALYLMGYAMDQGDNIPLAIKYYHKAIFCDSTLWEPYRDLAYLFDIFIQYDSMNFYLKKAQQYATNPETLLYDLGYSFEMLGQTDSALEYYHKAIAYDPLDGQAYLNIGALWGNKGFIDSARLYTRKSLDTNPNSPEVCYNYAEILASEGQREEAIDYFQKALVLNPGQVEAKLRLGELYEALGDSGLSRLYYQEFIDTAPPTYLHDIERIKAKLGIKR